MPGSSWKLLSAAVLAMLIGTVWWVAWPGEAGGGGGGAGKGAGGTNAPVSGLVSMSDTGDADRETGRVDGTRADDRRGAPLAFRMGLSFFVGFAVAFALRSVLTMAIVVVGFAFLLLFGLQYAGVIDVSWESISGGFDSAQAWMWGQVESVRAFAKGVLPSATAATVGLIAGWRRKRL
ncbi:MAG: FUN14 domain-containing protein [Phycisphaeraceae bacterium]|nr:FUN14 domain-containing protein [Phycisphaeraceae bacterium]